jgi:hypothetical protein
VKVDARTARMVLKLIGALPALIELGKQGAAAGRAITNALQRKRQSASVEVPDGSGNAADLSADQGGEPGPHPRIECDREQPARDQ